MRGGKKHSRAVGQHTAKCGRLWGCEFQRRKGDLFRPGRDRALGRRCQSTSLSAHARQGTHAAYHPHHIHKQFHGRPGFLMSKKPDTDSGGQTPRRHRAAPHFSAWRLNTATLRLVGAKYFLATRWISAAVTASYFLGPSLISRQSRRASAKASCTRSDMLFSSRR